MRHHSLLLRYRSQDLGSAVGACRPMTHLIMVAIGTPTSKDHPRTNRQGDPEDSSTGASGARFVAGTSHSGLARDRAFGPVAHLSSAASPEGSGTGEQSALVGEDHRLSPIMDINLCQHSLDVGLRR